MSEPQVILMHMDPEVRELLDRLLDQAEKWQALNIRLLDLLSQPPFLYRGGK